MLFAYVGMTGRRVNLRVEMERVMGIEPTLVAWEATVLPLNYTRRDTNPIEGAHVQKEYSAP